MSQGRVTRVRLFTDRAAITRIRTIEAKGGPTDVEFAPIPAGIDPGTLRAAAFRGDTKNRSTIRVTQVTSQLGTQIADSKRRSDLKQQLDDIEAKLSSLADAENTEAHAVTMLMRYTEIATEKLSVEWLDASPAFDKWGDSFDHLRSTRAKLGAARAARHEERRRLQLKRADLLEAEMAIGRPDQRGYRVRISLDVPADTNAKVDVELTYVTRRAMWSPCYDARYLYADGDAGDRVMLTGIALVEQGTGEDWEGVELIATTAQPPLSEPPPDLSRLVVSGQSPEPNKRPNGATPPNVIGQVMAAATRTTVEHRALNPVSIPATKRAVRIELFSAELVARARTEVTPAVHPVAHRIVEVMLRGDLVILAGPVNVFRGPAYVGQSIIGAIPKGGRFKLPLGADTSLIVRRTTKCTPIRVRPNGTRDTTFETSVTIDNTSDDPHELVVLDHVPVSRTDEATVTLLSAERGQQIDPDTGLSEFNVTVAPHSTRAATTSFLVNTIPGFEIVFPLDA